MKSSEEEEPEEVFPKKKIPKKTPSSSSVCSTVDPDSPDSPEDEDGKNTNLRQRKTTTAGKSPRSSSKTKVDWCKADPRPPKNGEKSATGADCSPDRGKGRKLQWTRFHRPLFAIIQILFVVVFLLLRVVVGIPTCVRLFHAMMCMLLFRNAAVWENFTVRVVGVTWSDGAALGPDNFWAPSAQQLVGGTGLLCWAVVIVVNSLYCYLNSVWGWKITRRALTLYF